MTINDLKPLDIEPVHDTASAHAAIKQAIITTNVATQDLYKHMTLLGACFGACDATRELGDICYYDMPPVLSHTGHLRNDIRALLEFYRQMTDIYARLQSIGIPFVCSKAFTEAKRKCARGKQNGNDTRRAVFKHSEEIFTYWLPHLVEASRKHVEEMKEMLRVADANDYADRLSRKPKEDPFEGVEYRSEEYDLILTKAYMRWKQIMELFVEIAVLPDKKLAEHPELKDNLAALYHNYAVRAQYALDYLDWFFHSRKMMLGYSFFGRENALEDVFERMDIIVEELEDLRDLFFEAKEMASEAYYTQHYAIKYEGVKSSCDIVATSVDFYVKSANRDHCLQLDYTVPQELLEAVRNDQLDQFLPLLETCTDIYNQMKEALKDIAQEDDFALHGVERMLSMASNLKRIIRMHPHFYFLEAETYEDPHKPDFTERRK